MSCGLFPRLQPGVFYTARMQLLPRFAIVIACALAGCQNVEATPSSTVLAATATPPAAEGSNELDRGFDRALEESVRVILRYLELTDAITAASGQGSERITGVVTPRWLSVEHEALAAYRERAERTLGQTRFEDYRLQLVRRTPAGGWDVGVIGCVDSSGVFVLGSQEPDPPPEFVAWFLNPEEYLGTDEEWEAIEAYALADLPRTGSRQRVVFWLSGEELDSLAIDSSEQWWAERSC